MSRTARAGSARLASLLPKLPKAFNDFTAGRDLTGTTVVLDSGGGSVNDAIALGRRWGE